MCREHHQQLSTTATIISEIFALKSEQKNLTWEHTSHRAVLCVNCMIGSQKKKKSAQHKILSHSLQNWANDFQSFKFKEKTKTIHCNPTMNNSLQNVQQKFTTLGWCDEISVLANFCWTPWKKISFSNDMSLYYKKYRVLYVNVTLFTLKKYHTLCNDVTIHITWWRHKRKTCGSVFLFADRSH